MDQFGIGAAVAGAAQVYFKSARQTGKTTRLIQSLHEGDRVVVTTHEQAQWMRNRAKQLGKQIEVVACPVDDPGKIFQRGPSKGRTMFDHDWVEAYYLRAIEIAQREISHIERESSGYGIAHEETRMKADAISRWRVRA